MPLLRRLIPRINPYLLLLLLLSCLALTPLFSPGYFYSAHDGRHSVFYLSMFDASLRDGAWWPRWAMHHIQGYGYPTFIIQAPLGFYLGELFVLLGAGYTVATKLSWATGFLVGSWGIYRLVLHWLGTPRPHSQHQHSLEQQETAGMHLAAVVAGLLYTFIPYHLVGIYVRAALNDTLLFAWFPWIFLAFDRLIVHGLTRGWPRRLALAALSLAGVLLTHTFALISFAPLIVTFVLFRLGLVWLQPNDDPHTDPRLLARIVLVGAAGLCALLLYANFLLPLLVEGQHLNQQVYVTDTYNFRNHFVYVGQFFNPFWGYGYSDDATGVNDGMSFQVGVMALLLVVVTLYLLWMDRAHGAEQKAIMLYFSLIILLLLFLMTPLAAPIWEAIPILGIIQFPWRLLSLAAFAISTLVGLGIWHLGQQGILGGELEPVPETQQPALLLLGVLIIFAATFFIQADQQPIEAWREDGRAIFNFEREHPDMIAYTKWVQTQPFTDSPMTHDYAAENYAEVRGENLGLTRLTILHGRGEVLSNYSRGSSFGGAVRLDSPATVRVNLYYFPGWQATVDDAPVAHRVSNPYGLIELDVPAGEHRIDVRMGSTPVRRVGSIISWVALAGMVLFLGWPNQSSTT